MRPHGAGQAAAAAKGRTARALFEDPGFPPAETVLELTLGDLQRLHAHWQRVQRKAAKRALARGAAGGRAASRKIEQAVDAAIASAFYGILANAVDLAGRRRWLGRRRKDPGEMRVGAYLKIGDVARARDQARDAVRRETAGAGYGPDQQPRRT